MTPANVNAAAGNMARPPKSDGGDLSVATAEIGAAPYPPLGVDNPSSTYASRLSGRAFLPRSTAEVSGYGLYSYVLFGSPPTDTSQKHYEATVRAFLQVIEGASQLEAGGVSKKRLNITYLPTTAALADDTDAATLLTKYDFGRAAALLLKLPGQPRTGGPYIVSVITPLSDATPPAQFLYQDLSSVPSDIIVPWVKAFVVQASKERFWERDSITNLVLDLRESIEIVALASKDLKPAIADWKSFLGSLISFNK
jgi:hypothetical protein